MDRQPKHPGRVRSQDSLALTDPVTVGLFVCAHTAATLNTSTFDHVSVTTPTPLQREALGLLGVSHRLGVT